MCEFYAHTFDKNLFTGIWLMSINSLREFKWKESDVENFMQKFKNHKNITAEILRKEYISGTGYQKITAKDRRNLMQIIVDRGYARVITGTSSEGNYVIRMNNYDEAENLYFDPAVLLDLRMKNLPQLDCLGSDPSVLDMLLWLKSKMKWLEIHNLFFKYQDKGAIDKKCLEFCWTRDEQKKILLLANIKIILYKVVKICCQEQKNKLPGIENYYNRMFLTLLETDSKDDFSRDLSNYTEENFDAKNTISFGKQHSLRCQIYGYRKKGQDIDGNYTEEEAINAAKKLALSDDIFETTRSLRSFAESVQNLLDNSDNHLLEEAVNDWITANDKDESNRITILNRFRNPKKRNSLKKMNPIIQTYPAQKYLELLEFRLKKLGDAENS